MSHTLRLELNIAAPTWRQLDFQKKSLRKSIWHAAWATLQTQRVQRDATLSVLLAGRQRLQSLNRLFRNVDQSTDILAFPTNETKRDGSFYLGDLALSHENLKQTAKLFHTTLHAQLTHLIIHGVLHLLAYDHKTPRQQRQMQKLETQALALLGLPDPWRRRD